MCGRFTLNQTSEAIANHFHLAEVPDLPPRYNIAPTQPVAAIVLDDQEQRQFTHFYWGLIPSWAKDPKIGAKMINARAETVAEKPAFRAAFKRRRCLIVTDFMSGKRWKNRNSHFIFVAATTIPLPLLGYGNTGKVLKETPLALALS
jgi:putative SOS response-associated peptidase YedK